MTTFGKYDLHEELGRGGFAVVYRALDTRLNREVALKVLNASLSEDPRFVEQFRREAQTAANLVHPNIVVIHEADEAGGRSFLAMQLLPGGDLRRRIERDGPLPFPLVVSVIEQIASALAAAHMRGLVHRDVKSANIILDDAGHATLTDFGLVRAVEGSTYGRSLSLSGGFAGTVEYMAPELVEGHKATAASDLYALGIVAYEMVTGQVPFKADTPLAVIRMQADKPAPDPRGLRPDLPEGIRTAILTALAKKPDERQADVTALVRELRSGWEAKQHAAETRQKAAVQPPIVLEQATNHGASHWDAPRPVVATSEGRNRRWLGLAGLGLGAASLLVLVLIVGSVVALMNNLNVSRDLAATQAAMLRSFATASAPATTVTLPTLAPPTTTPTLSPPSVTPTPVPPTTTLPSPTPALGIGSTQVSPADGMVLLYVPSGSFLMGSTDNDPEARSDEKPQHSVNLDAFWIDQMDVTNDMFAKYVQATSYQTDAEREGSAYTYSNGNWSDTKGADFQHPKGPGSNLDGLGEHPVIDVSWNDASNYCGWAGRRLPTEAEWEKAARGIDGRRYPWGNDSPRDSLLNFNQKFGDTTAAGSYLQGASPYGAFDMAGNVWQWVADWYSYSYYAQSPSNNPKGPASGQFRVLRGGSWNYGAQYVRAANRLTYVPDIRYSVIGFRCAR